MQDQNNNKENAGKKNRLPKTATEPFKMQRINSNISEDKSNNTIITIDDSIATIDSTFNVTHNDFNFSMLQEEDTTDEEDNPSANRPPAPEWSLNEIRYQRVVQQSNLSEQTVDLFFGSKAEEVFLREIFPKIKESRMKRKSSAVWNTPPRYSTLPKY